MPMEIKGKLKFNRGILPYLQAIPEILIYEAVSKLILLGVGYILRKLMMWSVYRTGRVCVSSGDFTFLFKSPYGWVAILTAVILVGVYVAFDINVLVNYAGEKVKERPTVLWKIVLESLAESSRFFTPDGLLVLLYSIIIAPIIGVGMNVSLTKDLYLPNFISDVIKSNLWYNIGYTAFVVIMVAVGILGMFTIHGMIIDHIPSYRSFARSAQMVIKNFWDLVWQLFEFLLRYVLLNLLLLLTAIMVPAYLLMISGNIQQGLGKYSMITIIVFVSISFFAATSLLLPMLVMKLTQLYYQYSDHETVDLKTRPIENHRLMVIGIISAYVICFALSFYVQKNFDNLFPADINANVIAHRGAGNEGGENTVSGIQKAIQLGCYGAEIDIQRTADGYYILNHDNTFQRVAGVNKTSSQMTLEEIKEIKLYGIEDESIPTIEEALDASADNIVLFVELKGSTADKKMCDDMVKLIKERNLEEYCVLISLKYDLIEYIEKKYPEIQTGYLAFITLGNVGELACDYLGLEEEAATSNAISAAHENGRKVMVWTPNSRSSQTRFLMSDADAIITDQTSQANTLYDELVERNYIARMIDYLYNIYF